ncbi:CvpA family protein [Butyrivibrio sp. WCD3002]|jgi:uncharacterized membrane protein required for colicin V production|uniref:CvpA family protein n=1 Tax=Butyrivibrio sp. WCD3002 TaxID=1280676 RepID=UPI00047BBFE5|nr:CvpA family protein [Butyrivibrio sp. WCD3002]
MDIVNFITQPQVIVTLAVVIMLMWRIAYGYKYGLISELLEIAALAVGFVVLNLTAGILDKFLNGGGLNIISSIVRIAVVVAIYRVIQGISKGVRGSRNVPMVSSVNKLLGSAFGFIEIYIWLRILNYIIGYDFEGAIKFTITSLIDLFN